MKEIEDEINLIEEEIKPHLEKLSILKKQLSEKRFELYIGKYFKHVRDENNLIWVIEMGCNGNCLRCKSIESGYFYSNQDKKHFTNLQDYVEITKEEWEKACDILIERATRMKSPNRHGNGN